MAVCLLLWLINLGERERCHNVSYKDFKLSQKTHISHLVALIFFLRNVFMIEDK